MSAKYTPWCGRVTLTLDYVSYKLSDLLEALPDIIRPKLGDIPRCEYLSIQADETGGGAKYYIGNQDMGPTSYGVYLAATQAWQVQSMGANLIRLDHVYVMSDTGPSYMNVIFITR